VGRAITLPERSYRRLSAVVVARKAKVKVLCDSEKGVHLLCDSREVFSFLTLLIYDCKSITC